MHRLHTGGWVHEVLAMVYSLAVVVAVVDEDLVGCPLVTVNYQTGQHNKLNDWNQPHCPAILDKLHVADTRCYLNAKSFEGAILIFFRQVAFYVIHG